MSKLTHHCLGITVLSAFACGCVQNTPQTNPHSKKSAESQTLTQTESNFEVSEVEAAEIKLLIRQLSEIADPDVGFSPTMSGTIFAPSPESSEMFNGILMNHGFKRSEALVRLVELGPKALPYLLDSLDDETPTKTTFEHDGFFGVMQYAKRPSIRWAASNKEQSLMTPSPLNEFNPNNLREKRLLERAKEEFVQMTEAGDGGTNEIQHIRQYTVTVGDICYVIIGQITNRTLLAAQYQPTACVYINSPTYDKKIAEDVRAVWESDDPAQTLFESLLIDFRTE